MPMGGGWREGITKPGAKHERGARCGEDANAQPFFVVILLP
jgi:hypothetical protein